MDFKLMSRREAVETEVCIIRPSNDLETGDRAAPTEKRFS